MAALMTVVLCALMVGVWTKCELNFPENFKFGAATSSYQIEGGWNASDKSPSIIDTFVHKKPESIADRSNGDVACDSYNLWKDDIQMASDIGLDYYRLSISWPRIMPTGLPDYISQDGYHYYRNLIDGLLDKGIEPVVTMYHWDLPQRLQNLGGWANSLIADYFADYARVLFTLFGDKVKLWITMNEPLVVCVFGYGYGFIGPVDVEDYNIATFQCNKNIMMAHAKAYRIYDSEFRSNFKGHVGITNQLINIVPATEEDQELAELGTQLYTGIYSHPIFSKEGGWPPAIEKLVAENSKLLGFNRTRLPPFTDEEREIVKDSADFYGINYYTSRMIRKMRNGENIKEGIITNIPELSAVLEPRDGTTTGASPWLFIDPEGLRTQLRWLKESFGDIEIIITENGYSTSGYNLEDYERIEFIREHLKQVLLSIKEDGVNVTRYTVWSLMDNFEWIDGYTSKFGLYEVDFEDPMRKRTPRASARFYKNVIRNKSLKIPKGYQKSDKS